MHIHVLTRSNPAPALNIEAFLDIVNQIIATLRGLESLLGIDLSVMLGKDV